MATKLKSRQTKARAPQGGRREAIASTGMFIEVRPAARLVVIAPQNRKMDFRDRQFTAGEDVRNVFTAMGARMATLDDLLSI